MTFRRLPIAIGFLTLLLGATSAPADERILQFMEDRWTHGLMHQVGDEDDDAPLGLGKADCVDKRALDRGRKLAIVPIDFIAAFDCVSHSSLLYNLRDVGDESAIFDVIAGFSSGGVQRNVVSCEIVRVVSSVVGWVPFCFTLYIGKLGFTNNYKEYF